MNILAMGSREFFKLAQSSDLELACWELGYGICKFAYDAHLLIWLNQPEMSALTGSLGRNSLRAICDSLGMAKSDVNIMRRQLDAEAQIRYDVGPKRVNISWRRLLDIFSNSDVGVVAKGCGIVGKTNREHLLEEIQGRGLPVSKVLDPLAKARKKMLLKKLGLIQGGSNVELRRRLELAIRIRDPRSDMSPPEQDQSVDVESLISIIEQELRPLVIRDPQGEIDIQDNLERLLTLKGISYDREKESVAYSVKSSRPDFTVKRTIALEVKFSKDRNSKRRVIDEISADLLQYRKTYAEVVFFVYDIGTIRDRGKFAADFEEDGARIVVVKH